MFAGKKSAQIREILISESAWEEMTCLFAPSLGEEIPRDFKNIPSHVLKKAVCCVENYCLNLEKEEVE